MKARLTQNTKETHKEKREGKKRLSTGTEKEETNQANKPHMWKYMLKTRWTKIQDQKVAKKMQYTQRVL